jgi:hypothetical protein
LFGQLIGTAYVEPTERFDRADTYGLCDGADGTIADWTSAITAMIARSLAEYLITIDIARPSSVRVHCSK